MANKEKLKTNKIREQVAKQYTGKIKDRDATIARLSDENKALRAENKELRDKLLEFERELPIMKDWLERMQDYVNLSDDEMAEVRRQLASSAEAHKAMESLGSLFSIFGRFGGGYFGV